IHLHDVPKKMLAAEFVFDGHVQARGLFFQAREGGRSRFPPQPQLADLEILQDSREAADMVLVGVRQRHSVQLLNAARPQVRRNGILARIGAEMLFAALESLKSSTAVN